MAYTPDPDSIEFINTARLESLLKLRSVNISKSCGPSIADPCGLTAWSVGFRDNNGNAFWVSIDDTGTIFECGAHLNGHDYKIPKTEIFGGSL